MSDKRTTAKEFHAASGVDDWRVLFWGAYAYYRTGSFAEGAAFVSAIAQVADALSHFPDVDLRPDGVTVHTFSRADGALSAKDIELARSISSAARELGLESDPAQLQVVGVAVAQDAEADVRSFFAAVLGYQNVADTDVADPHRRNANFSFQQVHPPRPGRGRTHIDISIPPDQVEARIAAALEAGGRLADDSHAPWWWTLASPDNHGVDVAAWPDFEDETED